MFLKLTRVCMSVVLLLAIFGTLKIGDRPVSAASKQHMNRERAVESYQALQKYFYQPQYHLYYETYPYTGGNQFSYAWSFSQAFAATIDISKLPKRRMFPKSGPKQGKDNAQSGIRDRLQGLKSYWDNQSSPPGYDSYVLPPLGGGGDKFYDDNDWLGLDLIHTYQLTGNKQALERAKQIFSLEVYGWDTNPSDPDPGGVFWTQASWSHDRNTVSNAPTAELGLYLYKKTGNPYYLHWAKKMYNWVNAYMLAPNGLYWDHVDLQGNVNKAEWSYNQGTMIGASVLFYKATGSRKYLQRAESIANAALNYYGNEGRLYKQPDYFNSIFFRNLLLLEAVNHNHKYRKFMQNYADHVWSTARDAHSGLFKFNQSNQVSLLEQSAMVQIYAMLGRKQNGHRNM